ncbi:MAG: serine/threonine protein phosphatase, partial [Clostridia bacterium]|nr:serine/threonine protein phosphatase [Clostridia bacterium]
MKSPLMIKWRYWNNRTAKAERASNYLNYIGTRDGVEKLSEEKTYLDYIGTRPRVEKFGTNGLFSDEGESLVMDAEREKLNQHQGRVSTLIISLSREDAEATGFNCAERWRAFMRTQKMELAKQFGIPPEHLKWYGAFHNEASHPHIHVLLYSTDPEHEGYLTKKGLEHIKSTFATEIFRHELDSIYQEQTKQRDELTKIARDEIAELVMRIQNGTCDNPKLIQMMQELAEKMKTLNGKKVYAFLPPELKSLVNEITDTLCEDENIKRLYDLWYESKYAILKSYTKHMPPQKPLSQEETFKPIRNAVIREALKLSADQQTEDTAQRVSSSGDTTSSPLPVT